MLQPLQTHTSWRAPLVAMLGSMLVAAGLLVAGIPVYAWAFSLEEAKSRSGLSFARAFPIVAMGVATLVLLAVGLVELGFYRYRVVSLARREKALVRVVDALDTGDQARKERMSASLHDDVGGGLTALRLRLERLRSRPSDPAGWDAAFSALDSLLSLVRGAARAFHPRLAAELGLSAVLRDMGEKLAGGGSAGMSFDFGSGVDSLGEEDSACVLNVVQEAVVNAIRHSGGAEIRVSLDVSDGVVAGSVSDDGRGFGSGPREGLGLTLMRERLARRGGSLSAGRSRLGGAELSFKFPAGRAAP